MKNKYYFPIVFVFVLSIFFTIYKLSIEVSQDNKVIKLTNDWQDNIESDNKLTIYGTYYLSSDLESDIKHDYSCKSNNCSFIAGNDNYAIIDDSESLIYSLLDNSIYYFETDYDLAKAHLLVNDNILYGIIFNYDNNDFYYSLKDSNYYLLDDDYKISDNSKYIVNKNLLLIIDNDKYSVINYLTGEHLIDASFIDINYYEEEKDYLIIVKDYKDDIINIFNSKLDSISVEIVNNYMLYKNMYILSSDMKSFIVKNSNNEIIKTSHEYDKIDDFINGFVIAELDNELLIIDTDDKVIKRINLGNMVYDSLRSGYYKELDGYLEGIYLYISNNLNNKEIYFNPKTYDLVEKDI